MTLYLGVEASLTNSSLGISVPKVQLEKIFSICKSNKNGHLTFTEFKEFILSEKGNKAFKEIVTSKVQAKTKAKSASSRRYIPNDFRAMLEYISWKLDRETIIKKLETEDMKKNALDFQNLFLNSDLNSNVSNNYSGNAALKLMFHDAKRRANSSHQIVRVSY